MLNETKVNDSTANNLLNQLSNHKYLHKQRNERNGAEGVSIIIKDCIEFDNYYSLDHLNLELISIKIEINGIEIILFSYYNPPDQTVSEEIFNILAQNKESYIIIGDLNSKSKSYG